VRLKHQQILERIFHDPIQSGIPWKDIEKLLNALGAEISEGNGSRVRISLNNIRAVFHRPHPKKETDKGAIASMRKFSTTAGIRKC
jgi:predicted RNA binding protein YcfA (HicA-like mRNA interferase family)